MQDLFGHVLQLIRNDVQSLQRATFALAITQTNEQTHLRAEAARLVREKDGSQAHAHARTSKYMFTQTAAVGVMARARLAQAQAQCVKLALAASQAAAVAAAAQWS